MSHTNILSASRLAALTALVDHVDRKAKTSVTLSGNLLEVIDALAGQAQRSAWIERAVRAYAKRQLRRQRNALELERLNRHAAALNAEGDDVAVYQIPWETE
jgi:hypothetical protein